MTPIPPVADAPMTFAIAMGLRRDDRTLRDRLDDFIVQRAVEIRQLLERYHVPVVEDGRPGSEPTTSPAPPASPPGGRS